MIPDWKTNKIYLSGLLPGSYTNLNKAILEVLLSFGIVPEYIPGTKDIWARDFMPIQVKSGRFIEYRYDPDYLQGNWKQKGTREFKTYPDIVCFAMNLKTHKSELIIDGGNVVKSENAVIMTDKVIFENSLTYSKSRVIRMLHDLFEVEKVIIIPRDEICKFGHADGMLRFINNDSVIISGFYETVDPEFKESLLAPLRKAKLNVEWLRCSKKETERNIAYINFLQTKDVILIPGLASHVDAIAFEKISEYYPEYQKAGKIGQVNVSDIFKLDGALNCISWTIHTDNEK